MNADSDILSEDIREKAKLSFVLPALRAGKRDLTISVRDVMREFGARGKGKQSLICSALKARKFQESNRMKLEMCEGPPSGRGTSTVYHYRFQDAPPTRSNHMAQ